MLLDGCTDLLANRTATQRLYTGPTVLAHPTVSTALRTRAMPESRVHGSIRQQIEGSGGGEIRKLQRRQRQRRAVVDEIPGREGRDDLSI